MRTSNLDTIPIRLWIVLSFGISIALTVATNLEKYDQDAGPPGSELLINVLKSYDIQFLFCLPGSDNYFILAEADKQGIRVINFRHEAVGMYAAHAVGRLTGIPGIVIVTSGPGHTNTVSGALNARDDEVPLIIIGGTPAVSEIGTGALHESDELSYMTSVCKAVFTIATKEDIVPILQKAFQMAMSDTPGPVYIQARKNAFLLNYVSQIDKERNGGKCSRSRNFIETYNSGGSVLSMSYSPKRLEYDYTPLPVTFPVETECDLETAADILRDAKRPVIIIGAQATLSPKRLPKLTEALESIAIPVHLDKTAKGILGRNHTLLMQYDQQKILQAADVVLLIGIQCDVWFRYGLDLPKNGKIITVSRNPKWLTLNVPKAWNPTLAVLGDPAIFIINLANFIINNKPGFAFDSNWIKICREISDAKEKEFQEMAEVLTPEGYLNPIKVMFELDKSAPPDAIWIGESGDVPWLSERIIRANKPLSFLSSGKYANCGIGMGIAIGTKLVYPQRTVILISGDGSIGFHIMEFDTCVRHRIGILATVLNDAGWKTPRREELEDMKTSIGSDLSYTDYHKIAQVLGGTGIVFDIKKNPELKIGEAIKELFDKQKVNSNPTLANILTGGTNARGFGGIPGGIHKPLDPYP